MVKVPVQYCFTSKRHQTPSQQSKEMTEYADGIYFSFNLKTFLEVTAIEKAPSSHYGRREKKCTTTFLHLPDK